MCVWQVYRHGDTVYLYIADSVKILQVRRVTTNVLNVNF